MTGIDTAKIRAQVRHEVAEDRRIAGLAHQAHVKAQLLQRADVTEYGLALCDEVDRLREGWDKAVARAEHHRHRADRAEARVAELEAENVTLKSRIEQHDEMRLAAYASTEMHKARAERDALRAAVNRVRALCDSYERSGYDHALIPKGDTIREFRAALGTAPDTDTTEDQG